MTQFFAGFLASGSKANAFVVGYGSTHILVDAGLSLRDLKARLTMMGLDPEDFSALLITHEHSDHTRGADVVSRKLRLPVYASPGTLGELITHGRKYHELCPITGYRAFRVGDIDILPVPTSHDAAESTGFIFKAGNRKIALATDLGTYDERQLAHFAQADVCFLESNHDVDWLAAGPYPAFLKKRVKSDRGHLSNTQAAQAIIHIHTLRSEPMKRIVLAHLSETNNSPQRALTAVKELLAEQNIMVPIDVARQHEPSRFFDAGGAIFRDIPGVLPFEEGN